jgi:hypothetical protein
MPFELTYNVTEYFLDRAAVQRKLDSARVKVLSRQGAFLRRRWRSSLRRRKSVSRPGATPSVHSRDSIATLKNILFYYDPRSQSVVVGMVKLNQRNMTASGNISIPALMEFGGSVRIREERRKNSQRWFRRDNRRRTDPTKFEYRDRVAVYAARPSGGPALRAEIASGTITESWANALRS